MNSEILKRFEETCDIITSSNSHNEIVKKFDMECYPMSDKFRIDEDAFYTNFDYFVDHLLDHIKAMRIAGIMDESERGYMDVIDETSIYWVNDNVSLIDDHTIDESNLTLFDVAALINDDGEVVFLVLESYSEITKHSDEYLKRKKNTFGCIYPKSIDSIYIEAITTDGNMIHFILEYREHEKTRNYPINKQDIVC